MSGLTHGSRICTLAGCTGNCGICAPAGPGTASFRWNWLLGELERRFPNPQTYRSDRGPEVWYLEAIDTALAAAERAGAERALRWAWRLRVDCFDDEEHAVSGGLSALYPTGGTDG